MSVRRERVQELLKIEISDILRNKLKDPRLGFVTITDVDISPDMRFAKVFVSILGDEKDCKINMTVLKNSAGFIRRELGSRIRMKMLPILDFRVDESVQYGVRIHEILEQIRRDEEERTDTELE